MWVFIFGASLFIAIETVGSITVLNTSSSVGAPVPKIIPESFECLRYVCVLFILACVLHFHGKITEWPNVCTELAVHVVSRESCSTTLLSFVKFGQLSSYHF